MAEVNLLRFAFGCQIIQLISLQLDLTCRWHGFASLVDGPDSGEHGSFKIIFFSSKTHGYFPRQNVTLLQNSKRGRMNPSVLRLLRCNFVYLKVWPHYGHTLFGQLVNENKRCPSSVCRTAPLSIPSSR